MRDVAIFRKRPRMGRENPVGGQSQPNNIVMPAKQPQLPVSSLLFQIGQILGALLILVLVPALVWCIVRFSVQYPQQTLYGSSIALVLVSIAATSITNHANLKRQSQRHYAVTPRRPNRRFKSIEAPITKRKTLTLPLTPRGRRQRLDTLVGRQRTLRKCSQQLSLPPQTTVVVEDTTRNDDDDDDEDFSLSLSSFDSHSTGGGSEDSRPTTMTKTTSHQNLYASLGSLTSTYGSRDSLQENNHDFSTSSDTKFVYALAARHKKGRLIELLQRPRQQKQSPRSLTLSKGLRALSSASSTPPTASQ